MYHNSLKVVKALVLALVVVTLLAMAPAKVVQAHEGVCNPICSNIRLYVSCYQPGPPYGFLPNDIETTWRWKVEGVNHLFSANGILRYAQVAGVQRLYEMETHTHNWPVGQYRTQIYKSPQTNPPTVSAWLYMTVNSGGSLNPAFYHLYNAEHYVCTAP